MAVVTHGSTLPDSAQKTDFYGIIDNATVTSITAADISASAAIADTQLATISTAGKVNTTALTGQVANANIAQLTTPSLVSGAALTLLANIPSAAGFIPSANLQWGTGQSSLSVGTIYQATQGDGLVFCCLGTPGTTGVLLQSFTDSNASPTTVDMATLNSSNAAMFVVFKVVKNNYFKVTVSGGSASGVVYYYITL